MNIEEIKTRANQDITNLEKVEHAGYISQQYAHEGATITIRTLVAEVERLTAENATATETLKQVAKKYVAKCKENATLKKAMELAEDMLTKMTPFKSKGGWHDRLMEQAQQTHETQEAEK